MNTVIREHQEWSCKKTGKIYSVDWCIGNTVGYSDGGVTAEKQFFADNPVYLEWRKNNAQFDEWFDEYDIESCFDESYQEWDIPYKTVPILTDEDGDEVEIPPKRIWIDNCKSLSNGYFLDRFDFVKEADWWLEEIGEAPSRMSVGQIWEWRQHYNSPFVNIDGLSLQERLEVATRAYLIYEMSRDMHYDPNCQKHRTVKARWIGSALENQERYTTYLDWRIPLLWNKTDEMRLLWDGQTTP